MENCEDNMDETPRQASAFLYYCTMKNRNLRQFAKEFGISTSTAGVWSKEKNWQERIKVIEFDAAQQLIDIVVKDWVETRAYLLRVLMKQVIDGVDAGVKPTSTRDMVAAIREIRSMMGEAGGDADEKREVIVYTRTVTDDEGSKGNTDL